MIAAIYWITGYLGCYLTAGLLGQRAYRIDFDRLDANGRFMVWAMATLGPAGIIVFVAFLAAGGNLRKEPSGT